VLLFYPLMMSDHEKRFPLFRVGRKICVFCSYDRIRRVKISAHFAVGACAVMELKCTAFAKGIPFLAFGTNYLLKRIMALLGGAVVCRIVIKL
jgi:hypothetical protein